MVTMLAGLVKASRELLMNRPSKKPWSGAVEASVMVFDEGEHRLKILGAVSEVNRKTTALDFSSVSLAFGDGIAGRAFKTNQLRLYIEPDEEGDEPQLYRKLEGVVPHKVLLSIPVEAPDAEVGPPYGVLNLGSSRADCPLRQIRPDQAEWESRLSAFKIFAEAQMHK